MDNRVYIVKCPDYSHVEKKMDELFLMMGGIDQFAKPHEKIVLKVNLLQPAKPEQAIGIHPTVVTAVARMTKKLGAIPVIADSPGAGYRYNEKTLNTLYHRCEMFKAAEEAGIEVNLDTTYQPVSFPEGKLVKHFEVITPVVNADGVFNLCKLKTHLFMSMTGAVKNNFGVIPGLAKPGYHANLHDKSRFAEMLLDLAEYVSPRLSIMDAVVGMEGDGPGSAGIPRRIGLLLGSRNQLALDVVAAEIIGLAKEQNPVLIAAEKRGLAPTRVEEVQLVGATIPEIRISDYKFPSTIFEGMGLGPLPWWQKLFQPLFRNGMSRAPQILKDTCIGCGICCDSCPMQAITIIENKRKYASINDKRCIRCYCCHELCPEKAVELRGSLLYRRMMRG
ncbi:MAG TPA: DUF362 domain-containing protein [Thermodesulfobacteriota bacterium]|nr:DUF362 domain-containing protein [Thermodesulfobacteriota bacterium]